MISKFTCHQNIFTAIFMVIILLLGCTRLSAEDKKVDTAIEVNEMGETIKESPVAAQNNQTNQAIEKKEGSENGKSRKKRFLEMQLGEWFVSPAVALKFGRGYDFSYGPKLNFRRNFGENKSLRFSAEYLPLSIRDISTDSHIGLYSYSANFRNFFRPRFFYEIGLGMNSFRPSGGISDYVTSLGGSIKNEDLINSSLSLAYQLFQVPYSYKKRQRKILFYLKLTWRTGDEYQFGANFGAAGNEYRNLRKGFSIRLYPMFRRF